MPTQAELQNEALEILKESGNQYRDEFRKVVGQLLPIIIAVIGATITVGSTEFAVQRATEHTADVLFWSTVVLGFSFLVGLIFLILESNNFRASRFAEGMSKMDIAEAEGKSRNWRLALAALSYRRSFGGFNRQKLTPEYRKMFSDALEAEKNNLQSWRIVRNPERFYSNTGAIMTEASKYLFFILLLIGGIGIYIFFSSMLFADMSSQTQIKANVELREKG